MVSTVGEPVGAAGMVASPYAAVVQASVGVPYGAAVVLDAPADAPRDAPMAKAASLNDVKELLEPSAPQLTANTMPAPQCEAGVLAA